MNYTEAFEKLSAYGQTHLLKFYDELSDTERKSLLAQIEETDFSVIHTDMHVAKRGVITPISVTELSEIFRVLLRRFRRDPFRPRWRSIACRRHGHKAWL